MLVAALYIVQSRGHTLAGWLTSSNAEPAKRQREIVNNEKKIDHFKRKASDSRYLPVPTIANIIEDANKIGDGTFSGY